MDQSLRILIIPDKFKGTITAGDAAKALARGWKRVRPNDSLTLLPMSDGGDGFGSQMSRVLGAKPRAIRTVDSAHRPQSAQWWWDAKSRTAVIEAALVGGLALLPPGKFHPFELDTFGLGAVFQAAAKAGARRCFIGIGGSSTNDGGFGLARAVGWNFLDREGNEILAWTRLHQLAKAIPPAQRISVSEITVAVDVQNPLLGPRGCSRIYGPQKGLRPEDFPLAERALRRLATVMKETTPRDYAKEPGAGAAGGLGFGLAAFLGARLEPGFGLFAAQAKLPDLLRRTDLVITGEGSTDKSSLMGKGVGEIGALCRRKKIPCMVISGVLNDLPKLSKVFTAVHALAPGFTSVREAKANPAHWLEKLASSVPGELRISK
ncbi:MAG TPA: glycerate kinase [Verrucomicrobiae bacterium]|nr:glycerate kinase [Verrucomicrobiae bacterium]